MPLATSYDEVPYPRLAFPLTHPSHLATVARLLGMTPAPVAECRVLELGCASGANLVPMAYAMPSSTFVGIDLSDRQISDGRTTIDAIGLTNIRLETLDIRAAAANLRAAGPFDYIIAHGIYSWVPDPVKDALLATCRKLLAPRGISYVSYNCYPGCQARDILRQMCQYHARNAAGPKQYATAVREFLGLMQNAVATGESPYRATLRQQLGDLAQVPDEVLLHDDLEGDNDPKYFRDFMAHAAAHGLAYVGDAYFGQMFGAGIKPEALEKIRHAGDRLDFEQYLDFLYGRSLRTTLLCCQEIAPSGQIVHDSVRSLWISTDAKPVGGDGKPLPLASVHPNTEETLTFRADECTLAVTTPLAKAALYELALAAPKPMPFQMLVDRVKTRLASSAATDFGPQLAETATEWFAMRLVELYSYCPPVAARAGERPGASAVARYQAEHGWARVTNLFHRRIGLDDELAGRTIALLDGRHDRAAIIEALIEPVLSGRVRVRIAGQPLADPWRIRPLLAERVEACLADFARHGLLVDPDELKDGAARGQ